MKLFLIFKRNFDDLDDISDEVFEVYKSQFNYNKPLNSKTTNIENFQDGYSLRKNLKWKPHIKVMKIYTGYISLFKQIQE